MSIRRFTLYISCFLISNCFGLEYSNLILYQDGLSLRISKNLDVVTDQWLSEVTYKNDINSTGFAYIEIKTNPNITNERQAYYAGYIEGLITADLIYSQWNNIVKHYCDKPKSQCTDIYNFIKENTKWIKQNIKKHKNDSYWQQVALYYTQVDGILEGYNANSVAPLTWRDIIWLNLFADVEDLRAAFTSNLTIGDGHCSVLIKILPEYKDIYFGHNTWSSYQSMLRFQKKYILNYNKSRNSNEKIPGFQTTFTGYPGTICSLDDFYLISSGLAVTETTNGIYNKTLWKSLTPNSVLESVRSVVANRLADNGASWYNIFQLYNSGTYNNQWMILDYKKFKVGLPPVAGAFYVIEQIPTKIVGNDLTEILKNKGYWASYNIPYYQEIYKLSGYTEEYEKYGSWLSYEDAPRAQIFKRDHINVTDMTSFMALMRSNNYKKEPFAHCDCDPPYSATGAIAARGDLNPQNGTYQIVPQGHRSAGAIDAKITNSSLFLKLQFIAVSGPTTGTNEQLPVFYWSKSNFTETPHLSHPDAWNFEPVLHKWIFA